MPYKNNRIACLSLLFGCSVFIAGCANYGAHLVPSDRLSYNTALQLSEDQQKLLNLVRLRYTDDPYFLTVNNVVSQFSISRDFNATLTAGSTSPPTGTGGVTLSDSPTVTYTPLQGQDYVTRLLTPIDLSIIHMLLRAGWDIDETLRITLQRMGPFENAISASRTASTRLPNYKEFQAVVKLMTKLQAKNNLIILPSTVNGAFSIKIAIPNFDKLTKSEVKSLARLGLSVQRPSIELVSTPSEKPGQIFAQTRTIMGIMNYLSKGVDVPPENIQKKRAHMLYLPDGKPFDWRQLTRHEMSIHYSKVRPQNARVAVRYFEYWYYIADDDFASQKTFDILSIFTGIYQGEVKSSLPVFTIS